MRIAIDSRILVSHFRGGILVYTERLIEQLSQIDPANRYGLLFSGLRLDPGEVQLNVGPNFKRTVLPVPDREFAGKAFLWSELAVPLYCAWKKADVYHLPAFHELTHFPGVKRVITIHDLRSKHIEDVEAQDLDAIRESCRVADAIITVSDFTKTDVVRYCDVPARKVTTVHLGVDEIFGVVDDGPRLEQFKERLGLRKPFFLCLGLVPRKNIDRLVEAYAAFRHKDDVSLVLAGHLGGQWVDRYKGLIKDHGLEQHVILPGAVSTEDLLLLYNTAHAFVFPSLCEGFGIPVLEAMACGAPVLTSNISALPEVVGDAALLVDPLDVAAITRGMETLAEDDELRRQLVEKGKLRARLFTWRRMAEQILKLYRSL